jgi:hypothetical protein
MTPMARWILQGHTHGPWNKLDVVGHSGTYQANESGWEKMEDNWSMKAEQGSVWSEKTSEQRS